VGRRTAKPALQVHGRSSGLPTLVELQKHFLPDLFSRRHVLEEVVCNAVNHRLMLAHDRFKSSSFHRPQIYVRIGAALFCKKFDVFLAAGTLRRRVPEIEPLRSECRGL
jgi:hypothetical protein